MAGKCLNWELRDTTLSLVPVQTNPSMYAVRVEDYSMGIYLQTLRRQGETVYQVREMPDLGVYRDPIEAVRGALGVAIRHYTGEES